MKQWFPFTDYDFYGYLAVGTFLIVAVDFTLGDGTLIYKTDWTTVQIAFWVIVAYVVGQIVAAPASALMEQLLARTVFHAPVDVLLGKRQPRGRERFLGQVFTGRYYRPLPKEVQTLIFERASVVYRCKEPNTILPETIYQAAYAYSRCVPDAVARIDQFRNIYGFNRNLSFVGLTATVLLAWQACFGSSDGLSTLLIFAVLLTVGCFGRFMKFYAACAREVLRTYAFHNPMTKEGDHAHIAV